MQYTHVIGKHACRNHADGAQINREGRFIQRARQHPVAIDRGATCESHEIGFVRMEADIAPQLMYCSTLANRTSKSRANKLFISLAVN